LAQIIFASGPDKGRVVPLGEGTLIFGRDVNCTVRLFDPLTSRRHFVIEPENGALSVSDKGSLNGTMLNGHVVDRGPLQYGDNIQIGNTNLYFVSDEEAQLWAGLIDRDLGGYKITRRLGRGGRATVYLAEQQSMQREVALKVLSEEYAEDENYVKRFVEEAQGAGRLQHPCVVQVFDVGSDEGHHFYSMEYFELGCVQDYLCQRGSLTVLEGLRMMSDVARGLEYAHSQKIVHRDIKPENLLLDQNGNIRIGDLGHAINADETKMAEGSIVGTPHYMSPEQASGQAVDHRSDLYALGCTAYKALSGRYPFEGQTHDEIITRQMTQMAKALHELKPEVPLNLCRIIQRLMAKKPEDRYQTATELLQDLTPLLLTTLQSSAQTSTTHTQVLSKLLSQVPGGDAPLDKTVIIG